MFTNEDIKKVMEMHALKDFLEVAAPDKVIKDAFFHDKDGNPVKLDTEGKVINEADIVSKEDFVLTNQTRKAQNEKDFQEIYSREFNSKGLADTPENHIIFKAELREQIEDLINLHKERLKPGQRDLETISLAERFLTFMSDKQEEHVKTTEGISIKYNPKLFHKFGFEFFKYLYAEYINEKPHGKQIRFMNVWKFFSTNDLPEYQLSGSRADYKDFINDNFNFKIKKEDPSPRYLDIERNKIDRIREFFEKNYGNKHKHLKNT